jgi:hypothetical protein
MASPPRRMTRARAKKEGYEPDWRINPNWKTPKKPKRGSRYVLSESHVEDGFERSGSGGEAPRMPSPTKQVRIVPAKLPPPAALDSMLLSATSRGDLGPDVATGEHFRKSVNLGSPVRTKLPPQPNMDSSLAATRAEATSTTVAGETLRKSVLGSPVRVRPRIEKVHNTSPDKENSSAAAILASWTSGKSNVPKTPIASRSRPLEPSPSTINTPVRNTSAKALSTPARVAVPQTPARPLGSARRIPVKAEKTKPATYNLDPIAAIPCPESHRDISYRVNQRPTSPTKMAGGSKRVVSPVRKKQPELEDLLPAPARTPHHLQNSILDASVNSPSTHWSPLKAVPSFQRPRMEAPRLLSARPTKIPSTSPPSRTVTKKDFSVDEDLLVPLTKDPKSGKRPTTPIPKFPIRRRSISDSASPSDRATPKSRITSDPVHFDSLEELKPISKVDKWKTPIKGVMKGPVQSVRKVCFRTPSMDTPVKEKESSPHPRPKSLSILTLATPRREDTPEMSTTPLDTPQSPSSPKVFDLSDSDNPVFNLFTPKKNKALSPLESPLNIVDDFTLTDEPETIATSAPSMTQDATFVMTTPKRFSMPANIQNFKPQEIPFQRTLTIPKGPAARAQITRQRDISVPIKDAHLKPALIDSRPPSAPSSARSTRSDREVKGPLNGVIAFVDVRTADGDDAGAPFADALKNLGAKVVKQWTWNGEEVEKVGITHVVFKQGGPRTLSKVKCSKGAVKCVGLAWISRYFPL